MGKTGKDFFVILAGGGGSRLWPKSRNRKPKQFLKLVSNRTMLQESFDRIADYATAEQIFIVTTCAYLEETKNELPKIPESNINLFYRYIICNSIKGFLQHRSITYQF